jgi:hypothetical protein
MLTIDKNGREMWTEVKGFDTEIGKFAGSCSMRSTPSAIIG